ncbi:hypothetical protein LTR33_005383 [Friedmanniomyces endolithicus]|nr:hypothetical protein LTR33_005383 [Friedmanniomyces endolithicus]
MLLPGRPRFRPSRLLPLLLVTAAVGLATFAYRHKTRLHVLQPDLYRWSTIGPSQNLLLPEKIASFCQAHGFAQYVKRGAHERKVYDLFLFATELDWLEVRLHTLSPYVDFFVIVESRTTFTGLPKPVVLQDHWDQFAPFHSKIIHRVIDDPGSAVLGSITWDHEDFLRNALLHGVFPELVGTWREAHEGDVLIVSDVDEIPKPETLVVLRKCEFPDRLTLRSDFYYYSFQWLHAGEKWAHPQVTTYRGLTSTIPPKDLRNGEPATHGFLCLNHVRSWWQRADLWDAAWHCSSCFATVREMQTKMESFSHTSWDTAENRDPKTIIERVGGGRDLFGREDQVYERAVENRDVPAYILQHSDRFGYLLDRDGEHAGFTDVDELDSPPSDAISSLRFSSSNNLLAVASWDRSISVYQRTPDTPSQPFTFSGTRIQCRAPVLDIAWGADDSALYSVGLDHDVLSINLESQEQTVLSTHEAACNKVAYSREQGIVLSTSWDSTFHVYNTSTNQFLRVPLPAKPFALGLTATRAIIAMAERKIFVYDLQALRMLVDQAGRSANGTGPNHDVTEIVPWQQRESSLKFMTRAIACMPDGEGFATSSIEGRVGVEWLEAGEQGKTYAFKCHRQTTTAAVGIGEDEEEEQKEVDVVYPVNALAFHPLHGTFATGGGDGVVCVWDAQTKRWVRQYPRLAACVAALDFSSDGRFLAIGVSPGFEDGKEDEEVDAGSVSVVVRELGENEAKGKPAK